MEFTKKALLIVAASFLLYCIYQTINATVFISHFQLIAARLPDFIVSSNPTLQLALFLSQELLASIGSYFRLIGSVFAFVSSVYFYKNRPLFLQNFRRALVFESLYFLLLLPAGINHVVGASISSSRFLNVYTGISFVSQPILIAPSLLMLNKKLEKPKNLKPLLKWAGIAGLMYIFGLWIKQALMWVYALSSSENHLNFATALGFANSWVTLAVAAIFSAAAWLTFMKNKKHSSLLGGSALVLVGLFFAIYVLTSSWIPTYLSFLSLTDFWMITMLILGIAIFLDRANSN
jgi:hypothetical protein